MDKSKPSGGGNDRPPYYFRTIGIIDWCFRIPRRRSRHILQEQPSKSGADPHVLFLLRPPVELYPPTLNQIAILNSDSFRVSVAHGPASEIETETDVIPAATPRYILGARNVGGHSMFFRLYRFIRFQTEVRRIVRKIRPEIVVACDPVACHALRGVALQCRAFLVWHFHELPENQPNGRSENITNKFVRHHADLPDLIIFPDPGRAGKFAIDAGIDPTRIHIVANCPRPVRHPPKPVLRELISDRVSQDVRIVIYNGSVGPDHGLDTAIRSMPEWPKDSVFVIKGHAHLEYAEEIKSLARSLGLDDRVIMLKRSFRSFEENYGIIAGADVGWTVLEPAKENWKYSALASNKRFECMALGVPQITDNNPGVAELIEGNECGICIQPDSVSAASDAVKRLLSDASLRDHMTECGRRIHLGRFNYDQQFAPILEKLNSVVDAPRS